MGNAASTPRWQRAVLLLTLSAAVVVLVLLHRHDPATVDLPACTFHRLTGWHCPGCGSMRATHHLLHGHVLKAFAHNALLMAAPFILGLQYLWWRLRHNGYRPFVDRTRLLGWLGLVVAWALVRNLVNWGAPPLP